jgi:protein O-mannosyl-transferase
VVVFGVAAIALHIRKAHPATTFALMWAVIGMLIPSNLIVVTGFVLAERALFLPSVGVAMLLGCIVAMILRHATPATRRAAVAAVAAVIVAGIARSSWRNPVWKDNATLFRQTAEDVPYSWKSHMMLGELLASQGKGEGILEMSLAVKLSPPNDVQTRYITARHLHNLGQQMRALPFYLEAMALDPSNATIRENTAYCLAQLGRMNDAIAVAKAGLRLKPGNPLLTRFLQRADSVAHGASPDVVVAAK